MKFSLLVATAAAIKIRSTEEVEQPNCDDMVDMVFKHCDADGNDEISWKEARGCGAPKEAKAGFEHLAGKDGVVDKEELHDICEKYSKGGLAQEEKQGHCGNMADAIYEHCDQNGDHGISWKEAKDCGAPKKWKGAFLHVAGKDGIVDKKEFVAACKAHGGLAEEETQGQCGDMADQIYEHCDQNGDHGIDWKEASDCGAPKKWKPAFEHVAGKDGIVDRKEFVAACKAHGGLAEEFELAQEQETQGNCGNMADAIYDHCDQNGDHGIDWKEASDCGAPKKWKPAFEHVAGKDGIVDKKEFVAACKAHGGLAEVEGPPCKRMAHHIWKHCDANGDKTISWKEAKDCGAPAQFKPEFTKAAGKDGELSRKEFMKACRAH